MDHNITFDRKKYEKLRKRRLELLEAEMAELTSRNNGVRHDPQ